MNESAVAGILGLALRARQLLIGAGRALDHVRAKGTGSLLVDESASENTRKRFSDAATHHQLRLIVLPEGLLGRALGSPGAMVALIIPGGLETKLYQTLDQGSGAD